MLLALRSFLLLVYRPVMLVHHGPFWTRTIWHSYVEGLGGQGAWLVIKAEDCLKALSLRSVSFLVLHGPRCSADHGWYGAGGA